MTKYRKGIAMVKLIAKICSGFVVIFSVVVVILLLIFNLAVESVQLLAVLVKRLVAE